MAEEIVIGSALLEIKTSLDQLKDGLLKAKAEAKKGASDIQGNLSNIKIQMDDRLLKLKINDVEKLYSKLKQRLEEKIKFNYDVRSVEVTRQQLSSVENALRGIKQQSNNTSKFGNLGDLFGNVTGISGKTASLVGLSATLGVIAKESVQASLEIEGVRTAFERLNQPDLLNKLRGAVRDTVNDATLMKVAMRAENFKIPMDVFAKGMEFAQKRAAQTGMEVDYLVNSFVDGLGRKSSLVLDNLGISASELQDEIKKTGDFATAAGAIVERELEKMGDVALTSKDKITQINVAFENLKVGLGDFIVGATNGFFDLIELAGKYKNVVDGIYSDAAEKAMSEAQKTIQMWKMATNEARKSASEISKTAGAGDLEKLINDTENKISALLSAYTKGELEYTGDLQNDLDQMKAKLDVYKAAHKDLTSVFDPYKSTLGAVKDRLDWVNEKILNTIKGSAEYNRLLKEQIALENYLKPNDKKTTVKVNFEIDDDGLEEAAKKIETEIRFDELFKAGFKFEKADIDALVKTYQEMMKGVVSSDEAEIVLDNIINKFNVISELNEENAKKRKKAQEEEKQRDNEIHQLRMSAISEFGNALEGLGTHGKTMVSYFNAALQAALRIYDAVESMGTDQFSGTLGIFSGIFGFASKFVGLNKGGTVTNFGSGNVNIAPHKKFASGTSGFTVPPGFNRDNYIVGVQSGERLTVTPANQNNSSNNNVALVNILSSINGKVGALNGNTVELLSGLINITVNKVLETKLGNNDIKISYDSANKKTGRYS